MMRRALVLVAVIALAALVGGVAVATAGGPADDDVLESVDEVDLAEGPDVPITGPDLQTASQVALAFTGGGRVTGTEVGDEESYYEVEVTLEDGREVDVQLDEAFEVVGTD